MIILQNCLCNIQVYAWTGEGDYDPVTNSGTNDDWEHIGSFEQDPECYVNRSLVYKSDK